MGHNESERTPGYRAGADSSADALAPITALSRNYHSGELHRMRDIRLSPDSGNDGSFTG